MMIKKKGQSKAFTSPVSRRGKGQAAMEFLMTYGWALLVVLIVIAALAFFGLLNPSRFLPEKCEVAPGLTCADFNGKETEEDVASNITILLNNGLGQPIRLMDVNLTGCTTNVEYNAAQYENTIAQGDTYAIAVNCSTSDAVPAGRFRSDLVLKYNTTVEGTTLVHIKNGYVVVEIEEI